jgi:hypothetical protein
MLQQDGGAIFVNGGNVAFESVSFEGNRATIVSESTMKRMFRRVGSLLSIVHGLM